MTEVALIEGSVAVPASISELVRSLEEAGALTPTRLKLPAEIDYEQYEALGNWIGVVGNAAKWWLSDWLVFGVGAFGDRMEQAAKQTGRSPGTLENYARVGAAVPPSRRRPKLTYTHHAEVASLPPREQTDWLKRAEVCQWGSDVLRAELRAERDGGEVGPGSSTSAPPQSRLEDAARSLLANAEEAGMNVICRREDVTRLRAALDEGGNDE